MVLVQQLRSLGEHHCDFAKLLPAVRAVRERLDWDAIRTQTADNDYAVAFLVLADRLGLTQLSDYAAWRPVCLSSGLNTLTCQALWRAS